VQEFWDHRYEYVEDIAERAVKAQFKEILCCFGGVPGPMARVVPGVAVGGGEALEIGG